MNGNVLVDTNIISEFGRKRPDENVIRFFAQTPRMLIGTMVLHELVYGVAVAQAER